MKKIMMLMLLMAGIWAKGQNVAQGLAVGSKAPAFTGKTPFGKTVKLTKLLKKGPVVLLFYRGQWCPYCNRQLKALQDSMQLLTDKGAHVLAVTPETAENVGKTVGKTGAAFPIISDVGLTIMKAYDVAFEVDSKTVEKYKGYGIDFKVANGSNGAMLPVPAVYIIGKDGLIKYRFFDKDYTKRPTVKDLLGNL